jgi:hypothetical protein
VSIARANMALEARVIAFEIGEELIQPRNLAELCSAFQLIAEEEEQIPEMFSSLRALEVNEQLEVFLYLDNIFNFFD